MIQPSDFYDNARRDLLMSQIFLHHLHRIFHRDNESRHASLFRQPERLKRIHQDAFATILRERNRFYRGLLKAVQRLFRSNKHGTTVRSSDPQHLKGSAVRLPLLQKQTAIWKILKLVFIPPHFVPSAVQDSPYKTVLIQRAWQTSLRHTNRKNHLSSES